MGDVVSKSDFARLCNVTAGRVSQWISEGKLSGAAIVGEGRFAKIDVDEGSRQLGTRLDMSQRLGLNGMGTRLPGLPSSAATPPSSPTSSTVEDQIKQERLKQERIKSRQLEADDAARRGIYMRTDDAKREMARIAGTMISVFEGELPTMAQAIAARFELPARDVLHLIRNQFREMRARASAHLAADAEQEDDLIDDGGADESEGDGPHRDVGGVPAAAAC